MPAVGFEPTRPEGHQVLSLARLPFHHTGLVQGYAIPPCEGPASITLKLKIKITKELRYLIG